jgi:hypothetical protein
MFSLKDVTQIHTNDFESQVLFVVQSVPRMLKQVELDPTSPMFGCAHLAYWRDKTSDVADMRRQEIMLTLALLYTNDYPQSDLRGNEHLRSVVEALLSFWCRNQYSDGSLDEWDKGERAFAAAAFTCHALARTLFVMEENLNSDLKVLAQQRLIRVAEWLLHRIVISKFFLLSKVGK